MSKLLPLRALTIFAALFFALLLAVPEQAYGQEMSRRERRALEKEWKRKAKEYVRNPLALKANQEAFEARIRELQAENDRLSAELNEVKGDVSRQEATMRELQAENQQLRHAYQTAQNNQRRDVKQGLVFKVQIGAFEHFDMNQYLSEENENFEGETTDGLNKYTIGNFRNLEIADAFRKDMQRLGIKDAWIVPYYDGVRIEMQEARRIMQSGGQAGN